MACLLHNYIRQPSKTPSKELKMPDTQENANLEQRLSAIASQNIKADANHLVESIRRQFSNPDEYSRELVANGVDAGATKIQIKGDVWNDGGAAYARLRFIDNGKGMSFADMQSYLRMFESNKDGTNTSVGKHGVGKLSPWADRELAGYIVDTCDGREHTELRMTSVNDGCIRRFAGKIPRKGTTVSLLWKSDNPLETLKQKLFTAQKVVRLFCRYLDTPVYVDGCDEGLKDFFPHSLTVRPGIDGWIYCGTILVEGTPAAFHYNIRHFPGVMLHQGGILVAWKNNLGKLQWEFDNLAIMVDSHAFKLPISRNDVIEDPGYRQICSHLTTVVLPGIIEKICRWIATEDFECCDLTFEDAANIVIDYLRIDPCFKPAQDLPLIPVLPFGLATVNQLAAARCKHGSLLLCRCAGDEFDGVTGHDQVVDEKKLTNRMEKYLKENLGPLISVDYKDEAVEAPAGSAQAELSLLERRFQESLVLLCGDKELERLGASGENGTAAAKGGGWLFGNSDEQDGYGPLHRPDLPDLRFKLTRLVRLDGKTPVTTLKFQVKDTTVLLNLNHPDVQAHLAFANYDPDLAAHWCLRELILSDQVECFKHLNYDVCERLVLYDAVGRCVDVEAAPPGRGTKGPAGKGYWNDDRLDWEKLFGGSTKE
jgi:hypothetical protein